MIIAHGNDAFASRLREGVAYATAHSRGSTATKGKYSRPCQTFQVWLVQQKQMLLHKLHGIV